jgi:hypothetical protein
MFRSSADLMREIRKDVPVFAIIVAAGHLSLHMQ